MTAPDVPAAPPSPTLQERDDSAVQRDGASEGRDRTAEADDERAAERDRQATLRESAAGSVDLNAVADRTAARQDRIRSSEDREHTAGDRIAASADRAVAADERAGRVLDGLTGAHHRGPGLVELDREIIKARRTAVPFVLAFLDVDGLKHVNDTHGHAAGDRLLGEVVRLVRAAVREYDLVIRYGGDEFLCGLLDISMGDAATRLTRTRKEASAQGVPFSFGLALLGEADSRDDLIARADAAMYAQRDGTSQSE
jgi:diguanylate cyclase (GGDEF)-like protein